MRQGAARPRTAYPAGGGGLCQSSAPMLAGAAQPCMKPTGASRLQSGGGFVVVVDVDLR